MPKQIKFGLGGIFMPPAELNAQAVQGYEAAGLDFVAYWDQLCMTFPRSIWTPDIVPAAETYDIDCYLDAYALMTQAAMVTEELEIGLVGHRRAATSAERARAVVRDDRPHRQGPCVLHLGGGRDQAVQARTRCRGRSRSRIWRRRSRSSGCCGRTRARSATTARSGSSRTRSSPFSPTRTAARRCSSRPAPGAGSRSPGPTPTDGSPTSRRAGRPSSTPSRSRPCAATPRRPAVTRTRCRSAPP